MKVDKSNDKCSKREILGQACFLARLHTKYSKKCFYVLQWINVGHSKTDLSILY